MSDSSHAPSGKSPVGCMLTLMALLLITVLPLLSLDMGATGKAPDPPDDYVIPEEQLHYSAYHGPVLPLTLLESEEGLSAERYIHYDFTRYSQSSTEPAYKHSKYASVTDRYVLTNETDSDLTVTAVYPFTGSFQYEDRFPSIQINGETALYSLRPGIQFVERLYYGNRTTTDPDNYLEFRKFLADSSYFSDAFAEFPSLDIPVVVYHLYDMENNTSPLLEHPRLGMEFTVDFDRTVLYVEGNGYAITDRETGDCYIQWTVSEAEDFPKDGYVIVIGADLEDYAIHGYGQSRDLQSDEPPVEGVDFKIERYESTLDEMFRQMLILERINTKPIDLSEVPPEYRYMIEDEITIPEDYQEIILQLATTLIYEEGVPCPDRARFFNYSLPTVAESVYTDYRIFYACFEVTVPAGGELEITAEVKQRENDTGDYPDVGGFDLVTTLGSNLTFTRQWASISGRDASTIHKYNNLRFDPENPLTELDLQTEHYWMELSPSYG